MTSLFTVINRRIWRQKFVSVTAAACLILGLSGCGGYNNSPTSNMPQTSGIKKRVLLSNQQTGTINIIDASKDVVSTFTISIPGVSKLFTAGGFTAANASSQNQYSAIDDSKEQATEAVATNDRVVDVAVSKDGKTAYAAVRTVGLIYIMNTADGTFTTVSAPTVSRLVLSPNSTKLLGFSDDANALTSPNARGFFVLDTASKTISTVTPPTLQPNLLDQPFNGVFGTSETQAFILNCGAECGGTAATVVSVDFTNPAAPVFGTPVPVSAATVGLLSGTNLFVAGTPSGSANGTLQTVNTSSLTASAPVSITDGKHLKMQLVGNNRLYVGAAACTPVNDSSTGLIRGCLTIFNTSSSALVFPEFNSLRRAFDVTGIQAISNRNVAYVCEGGELDIYDTTTDKLTPTQIDIVGFAFDVVQIDP